MNKLDCLFLGYIYIYILVFDKSDVYLYGYIGLG